MADNEKVKAELEELTTFKATIIKGQKEAMILRAEDKWIISKANTLVKEVAEDLEKLFFHKATRKINNFILVVSH